MDTPITPEPESAHILVVDYEGAIRYSISKTLQRVGYQVSAAASGEEALDMLVEQNFDVVLTDIRMPGLTGVELLARIKEKAPDSIVILMTGYASLGTAVESLRLGAHDYLIKPSSSQDIRQSVARGLERAHNLHRRRLLLDAIQSNVKELTGGNLDNNHHANALAGRSTAPVQAPVTTMTLGPLTIFPGRYQIQVGEKSLNLTPTEFDLLRLFLTQPGHAFSRQALIEHGLGYAYEGLERTVDSHIKNLRKKLERDPTAPQIETVYGIGYRLHTPTG